ncbi:myelin basic protein-like isoform X1 [Hoplias malabaricus]|uniref:myelin basic protein-like isoform X1 n=1 Tax=Hoplias malabaricus TaxID=27720 RepID=UPI003462EF70
MGQHLGKREPVSETKDASDPATRTMAESQESQDDVFGERKILGDVNQNKDSKKSGDHAPSDTPDMDLANEADPSGPRRHLARLFSRDAPGREDNTFKERPSESDELHTIPECGAGLDTE